MKDFSFNHVSQRACSNVNFTQMINKFQLTDNSDDKYKTMGKFSIEIITAYTNDDEQCILNSYPRMAIKELANELNMTERTVQHVLKINGKIN